MPCCYSVIKSCPTLFNPLDCSKTGFPVLHYLSEFAQIHVHWVGEPPNHLILCSPFPLFLPPTFPASGSFPISQLFTSGDQSTGASASALVLPVNIQGWFPLGLTVLISLQSRGLSRVFSSTTIQKHEFFSYQPSLWSLTSIHDSWKNRSFDYSELCRTVYQKNLTFTSNSMMYLNF